jgi:hypothetical protein
MTETPLIYTSKGNLPIDSLKFETKWEDADTYTKFTETYLLDGEVVKQSSHVMVKRGLTTEVVAGKF